MNDKTKYTLAFIAVLLIGFVLGFLVSGRLIHNRINRMQRYYTPTGFRYEIRRILRPTPEQWQKMKPVLEEYARKNRENMMNFRQQQIEFIKKLQHDLKPFLSPQQIKRLEKLEWHRRKMMKNHRMHRRMYPPPNQQPPAKP
ncbi:hypothetical protein LA303_02035 [Candidatus Sulfidibacterium hydrothermale]|uniref:hypothetical protein n=1 Tax=Candidatus Sulfidibacterium hydrothermale TaxID=2875962 RepID=UPI001F0A7C05|nr:hypothetical protein [Candidatus Sulfidibacterium hydrothermale]UBM62772.1 hypothetical protein LA303_02035 [Candidatus Sulfidibacterium hydrothermale]